MHNWLIGLLAALRDSVLIDIKLLCVEKQEAIAAKDIFWEQCSEDLKGAFQKQGRKSTPVRDECTAHCEDILAWMRALDSESKLPEISVGYRDIARVSAAISRVLPDQCKPTPAPVDTDRHSAILSKLEEISGLVQTASALSAAPLSAVVTVRNSWSQTASKVRSCSVQTGKDLTCGEQHFAFVPHPAEAVSVSNLVTTHSTEPLTTGEGLVPKSVPILNSSSQAESDSGKVDGSFCLVVQGLQTLPLLDHVLSICLGKDASKHIVRSRALSHRTILVQFKDTLSVNTILENKSCLRSTPDFFNTYIRPYRARSSGAATAPPGISPSAPDAALITQASASREGVSGLAESRNQATSRSIQVRVAHPGQSSQVGGAQNTRSIKSDKSVSCNAYSANSRFAQKTRSIKSDQSVVGDVVSPNSCSVTPCARSSVPPDRDQGFIHPKRFAAKRPLTVANFLRGSIFDLHSNFPSESSLNTLCIHPVGHIDRDPTFDINGTDFPPLITEVETRSLVEAHSCTVASAPCLSPRPEPSAPRRSIVLQDIIELTNPFLPLAGDNHPA